MKKMGFVAAAVLTAALAFPYSAFAAEAPAVLHVSPGGSDASASGTSASPYGSIQTAVEKAPAGSIIIVEPGTYKTSVTITKPITLESDPQAANADRVTIIDAAGQANGIVVAGDQAAGAAVQGFTVEHADNHGIWVHDSKQVAVKDNLVIDNGLNPAQGISENKPLMLDGTSYSVIEGNTVQGNQADGGISISDDGNLDPGSAVDGKPAKGSPRPGNGNLVKGNTITRNANGCGVVVASYNPGEGVSYNQVVDNSVTKGVAGIVVAADPPGTTAAYNTVRGNSIEDNFIPGVIIHSNAPKQTVIGTVVADNTIAGNGPDKEIKVLKPIGIAVVGAVDAVQTSTIVNNRISREYYGVYASNEKRTVLAGNACDSSVTVPVTGIQSEDEASGQANYTIKPGDTLWRIAKSTLGSGFDFNKIYELNKQVIGKDPRVIVPGEKLIIPGK